MAKTRRNPRSSRRSTRDLLGVVLFMSGLALLIAFFQYWNTRPILVDDPAQIVVYKRANCGCCDQWVAQLRDSGLSVSVQSVNNTQAIRRLLDVPEQLGACHTAQMGDYWVEGHVPIDLVVQLFQRQPPDVMGIAVAGMPLGSPGMEGPGAETFQVMRVMRDGTVEQHAERMGAESPPSNPQLTPQEVKQGPIL